MTIWYNAFRFGKTQSAKYSKFLIGKLPSPQWVRHSWLYRWFGEGMFRPELWEPTRYSLAMGMGVGWFSGLLPIFGFQKSLAFILGFFLRCHFPTAVLGTLISNPLTIPAILVLQYGLGIMIYGALHLDGFKSAAPLSHVFRYAIPIGIGALASALAFAILGFGLVWFAWGLKKTLEENPSGGLRASETGS